MQRRPRETRGRRCYWLEPCSLASRRTCPSYWWSHAPWLRWLQKGADFEVPLCLVLCFAVRLSFVLHTDGAMSLARRTVTAGSEQHKNAPPADRAIACPRVPESRVRAGVSVPQPGRGYVQQRRRGGPQRGRYHRSQDPTTELVAAKEEPYRTS